uniref:Uncharacterized protein n=1 Tax=Anguilla anguilla TaxID=7936 RepID=A0A0E9XHR6_ANGAN
MSTTVPAVSISRTVTDKNKLNLEERLIVLRLKCLHINRYQLFKTCICKHYFYPSNLFYSSKPQCLGNYKTIKCP